MPKLRYQLRTLLLLMLVFGCGLGWWFRPYTMEKRWPSGKLKSQLHVRRTWQGEVVTNGQQSWWWSNGQLARRGESHGETVGARGSGIWTPLKEEEVFNAQGESINGDSVAFGILWLQFHQDSSNTWKLRPDDEFPETPHTQGASAGGSILFVP